MSSQLHVYRHHHQINFPRVLQGANKLISCGLFSLSNMLLFCHRYVISFYIRTLSVSPLFYFFHSFIFLYLHIPFCSCVSFVIQSLSTYLFSHLHLSLFTQRERCIRIQDIITACFVTCSVGVALVVSDLGTVLGVVGATGSTMVSFVIPGACYYTLFPHAHFKRKVALFQFSLGMVIMPMALTAIAMYSSSE